MREERYEALGLGAGAARRLARSDWADLFDELRPSAGPVARRLAAVLGKRMPHYRRAGALRDLPDASRLTPAMAALEIGEVRLEAMERMLDELIFGASVGASEAIERYRRRPEDEAEFESVLSCVTRDSRQLAGKSVDAILRWGMGRLMRNFLGRLDPALVRRRLVEALGRARLEVEA